MKMVCLRILTYYILWDISSLGRKNGSGREVSSSPIGVSHKPLNSTFPVLVRLPRDSEIQLFRFGLPERSVLRFLSFFFVKGEIEDVTVKKCDDVKPMITPVKLGIRSNADMSRFFGTTFREFPFHTMRFLTVTILKIHRLKLVQRT